MAPWLVSADMSLYAVTAKNVGAGTTVYNLDGIFSLAVRMERMQVSRILGRVWDMANGAF
jgi:hypothetical protein